MQLKNIVQKTYLYNHEYLYWQNIKSSANFEAMINTKGLLATTLLLDE